MRNSRYLGAMLLASAALAVLVSGCLQDPYLTGANIVLNKDPVDITQDDYQQVIKNLKSAIEQGYPENYGRYYSMLARCYYYTNQFKLTRTSLDSAVKYWPDKTDSLNEVINGYWGLEYNKAVEQMRRAAAVAQESSKVYTDKAQENINNAMAIQPDKVENHIIQAKMANFMGRTDEAKKLFEKAVKADPKNADVYHQLGLIAYGAKDWDQTVLYYEKAVGLKADVYSWFFTLGEAYINKKDYPKAQSAFRKAADLKPEEKDAWFNLGLSYYNEGKDLKAAAQAFEKVVGIVPDDINALEAMGFCYLSSTLADYDNAIKVYKKATELQPDKLDYWRSLLYAYKQKKMKAEVKEVEKTIKRLQR